MQAGPVRSLLQTDNSTSPLPSPSPAPAAPAADTFVPVYLDQALVDVAALLQQAADPGAGWASSGDNGVYIGVANQPGRQYQGLTTAAVAAGPIATSSGTKADAADRDNVVVTFSGNLQGNCTDENGVAITNSDSCVVPVATIYVTDSAGAVDPAIEPDISVPSGYAPVSGAVTLEVAGTDKGALPCTAATCYATLRFPVMETANASKLYQCFQVVDGQVVLSSGSVASAASRAIDAGNTGDVPTFSCNVKQAGTYLVGKYPDPNYGEGVAESPYANITGLVSCCLVHSAPVARQFAGR